MRTIQEVKIGEKVTHPEKGEGIISGKTKSTCKNSYNCNDAYFYPSDF